MLEARAPNHTTPAARCRDMHLPLCCSLSRIYGFLSRSHALLLGLLRWRWFHARILGRHFCLCVFACLI